MAAALGFGCAAQQHGSSGGSSSKDTSTNEEISQAYGPEIGTGVADIRAKRQAALAAPADFAAASAYGAALYAGLEANYSQVNGVDWATYANDAAILLGNTSKTAPPEPAAEALIVRAAFLESLNDSAGALQSMRDAFARAHTYHSGLGIIHVYGKERNYAQAQTVCQSTRALAKSDEELFTLIETCLGSVEPKSTSAQALPWVSADDWATFTRLHAARSEKRLAAREAEQERDRQLEMERQHRAARASTETNSTTDSNHAGRARAGNGHASFTLHNACSKTVKLFYGKTPKFGSGRTSSISGNTLLSESMNEGDMIWIIDDSEYGISNFTASSGVREVEIGNSCTSFIVR